MGREMIQTADTYGIDASRSWRKVTAILADTQLSFHIIPQNLVGRELSSKKSLTHKVTLPLFIQFPLQTCAPMACANKWPTSNKGGGAAQAMHMQQGKWVYFHLYQPSQHRKPVLWRTDRYITKQSKIKSQFFFHHVSFIMIPLLKSPGKQIFLCDCEETFWGSGNCFAFPSKENKGRPECRN